MAHEIDAEAIELGPPACRPRVRLQSPVAGGIATLVGRQMDEVERDLIIETLGHTLGNRTHAATILGISIRALRNKLRDYCGAGCHGAAAWRGRRRRDRNAHVNGPRPPSPFPRGDGEF